jgi:hypothetical protein
LRQLLTAFGIVQKSVPFCRAANGALARRPLSVSLCAMAMHRVVSRWIVRLRAQRRGKDVWLAIALTLAAVIFIAAAMGGTDRHAQSHQMQSEAPHSSAEK